MQDLTKEGLEKAAKEALRQRQEAFAEDYEALKGKHRVEIAAVIDFTPKGIVPRIVVVESVQSK